MENFTNETIDITNLPKYEEVVFTALHSNYKKVVLLNVSLFSAIIAIGFVIGAFFNPEKFTLINLLLVGSMLLLGIILVFFFSCFSPTVFLLCTLSELTCFFSFGS